VNGNIAATETDIKSVVGQKINSPVQLSNF